ncbi:Mitochondrial distribution and morphology protein 12 [Coemansia sp. RSA 2322]|nr:Mitochondrial distribution and morphology protein 12 [Coemansia sp. RSA 2322]
MFAGRNKSGKDGDRPPQTNRLLQTLYSRNRSGSSADQHSNSAPPRLTPSSTHDLAAKTDLAGFSMLESLRRTEPRPTVELARPATEVAFTRVSDIMRPAVDRHAHATSASLLALRATQQGPGFARAPHAQSPLSTAIQVHNGAEPGSSGASATSTEDGGGEGGHIGGGYVVTEHGRRMSLFHGGSAREYRPGGTSGLVADAFSFFNDEHDVPFRLNAVEIAAQDDKNECAFLSHHFEPNSAFGSESERARSILPLLVGQLHPTVPSLSRDLPTFGDRVLEMPTVSSDLRKELASIQAFNQRAKRRLSEIDPHGIIPEFALCHLQRTIRQLLEEIDIPESRGWDTVILRLVLNAISRVQPNVRREDSMDLRRYVRIKRIPGGVPDDSQYISGIVFTKNLAHRRMPRYLESPRIMLLTFPLEYTAPSKHVLFDDELRVQHSFTEKLIQRITGAAPDIVMAEKHVPRQVLEGLMRNKICAAYGVKRSVIRAICRCTGAEIVTSMDKFSDYPRTGVCESIAVQTYEDESIPEFRKSFIFLDGCADSRGGTIVLRGEPFDKLGDIKQVVDLVVCLAYSMLLESSLLLDEFALAAPGQYDLACAPETLDDHQSLALQALSEYNIVLSSSPCVRIPPPRVLVSMREKELATGAITEKFNRLTKAARRDTQSAADGLVAHADHSTGVSFLVSRQQSAAGSNRLRQQYESELALHESHIHEGEVFLDTNPQAVSLWDYQSIAVAYMVTCRKHDYLVCTGPQYHSIAFYSHSDVTLGQYLEEMCFDLQYDCPSNNRPCTHPMYEHRRSYIHHHGKIDVTMDEHPCPVERMSETILMWGECRVCRKQTPVTRMSDESWRYSFGKYLETTFYNDALVPRACVCPHDIHRDYVRFFSLRNMAVKFEYSSFPIWNVAAPTTPLYFNMEVSIRLKEEEARELRKRLGDYYASLTSRLDAFPLELVFVEKVDECKRALHLLAARAATEQMYFQQTLEQTLRNTPPADTLVIVVVYEALERKVVEWNLQFTELVQSFIQLDTSSRAISMAKRVMSSEALASADGAQAKGTLLAPAKEPEIDSLQVIDELHSAAHHDYGQGDTGAHDFARYEMPHVCASPSTELSSELLSGEGASPIADIPMTSRIYRRLSMETMKQERERLEKLQDKLRRTADTAEGRGKIPKTGGKAGAPSDPYSLPPRQSAHQDQASHPLEAGQRPEPRQAIDASRVAGYSTTRLIGGIATDVDYDVPVPRQTEFPELRSRKGKANTKYAAGYGSKDARPLFDILQRPAYPAAVEPRIVSQQKEASLIPSRIPGIRSQQHQPLLQQSPSQLGAADDAQPLASERRSATSSRPLSSFGKPPDTRNSNIPRPPNIRGRATSPTGAGQAQSAASAPASRAAAGAGDGGDEQTKGTSNVFLRLAKRLNSAKGGQSTSAALGSAPRKMNLLLPAAAQYMSQHPQRSAMPQVQVFYTKPSPSEESMSRKMNSARRHSYQVPPNHTDAALDLASAHGTAELSRSRHSSSTRRGTEAIGGIAAAIAEEPGEGGALNASGGRISDWPSGSARRRSATVSRAQPRAASDGKRGHVHSTLSYPPIMPHTSRSAQTAGLTAHSTDGGPSTHSVSRSSVAARASNIIPSITRRLGLGFGFRSSTPRNSSDLHDHETARTTDDEDHPSTVLHKRPRTTLAFAFDSKATRPPIPAQLVTDFNSARQGTLGRPSTGNDSLTAEPLSGTESSSPESISLSIESSESSESENDIAGSIDDHLPYYSGSSLGLPNNRHRSGWSRHAPSTSTDRAAMFAGTPDSHMDLSMSSPMRTTLNPLLQSRHWLRMPAGFEGSADDMSGSLRASVLESSRQGHLRMRRDSSTEDDELDTHEPDLHFDQSDSGSDGENIGSVTEQDAKSAAEYLHSVITASNEQVGVAGRSADFTHEPSTASASTPATAGMQLTKISSFESSMDPSAGGLSGIGEASATLPIPQKNMAKLWKTISNLLMASGGSQLFQIGIDLKYPLDSTEHVVSHSPIIVRESEPSSIIAFALMASEYRKELHAIFEGIKSGTDDASHFGEASRAGDGRGSVGTSLFGGESEPKSPVNEFVKPEPQPHVDDDAVIERVMLQSPGHHLVVQFVAGQTEFVCKVYYAAQFEALRRCNGCQDSYIESLSRCMPYVAQGGKSGSAFLRTKDKRFIIKDVLKAESDAFVKFAPFYFKHMYRTYRDVMLTVMVKIFGLCRVSYRNAATGKTVKMNVIIMENLFYERNCKPIFDLKGSERNRMVSETGVNEVLQDENFVKLIRKSPICIRQQTKRHLHDAIWNDTLFLSKMNVMDYSLLVGVDESSNELVIGIVDFIRTFTWDKKLESWVKETGILGSGGKGPTIVSPKQYKKRFREAMERYFLMVPDKFFVTQAEDEG